METATQFWRPTLYNDNKHAYVTFDKAYTRHELEYLDILCRVLSVPEWWIHMKNEATLVRWRRDLEASKSEFNYLIAELNDIAQKCQLGDSSSMTSIPLPVHGVFMTDGLYESPLIQDIRSVAWKLENEARHRGDFDPKSSNQVVNVVHPSMYCAVTGRTRFSETINALLGDRILAWPEPDEVDLEHEFQWLPTPVTVDAQGTARFGSYINNIHPTDQAEMYKLLESLFSTMLPLFELSLGSREVSPVHRIQIKDWDRVREALYETSMNLHLDERRSLYRDTFTEEMVDDRDDEIYEALEFPELPRQYENHQEYPRRCLTGMKLQVIVKIESIELTPENPKWPGRSWHFEGMPNESIAATGIFFYDCENITTPEVWFRHIFDAKFIQTIPYGWDHETVTAERQAHLSSTDSCVVSMELSKMVTKMSKMSVL
ncbi:hypothetical protein AC1031_005743 [Aphanomyces cochlioides]|nr:hypothetical protein AC1031_005741 [Aphanomyces cochlioides]KAG9404205.1 hypothetical protein AC1031_005743 [Aphanomyces cochlioides]